MHQSGHSRAQSMQTVQFSSSSAITPRERGGSSGATSGYCRVWDRRVIVRRVTANPLANPFPGTRLMPLILPVLAVQRDYPCDVGSDDPRSRRTMESGQNTKDHN